MKASNGATVWNRRRATRLVASALILAAAALPMTAQADPDPDLLSICGGHAPEVTACERTHETAARVFTGRQVFRVPGYVGTLVQLLEWSNVNGASGTVTLSCVFTGDIFQDGEDGDCSSGGTFPTSNVQTTITQRCFSFVNYSEPPQPGGEGEWRCRFGHV